MRLPRTAAIGPGGLVAATPSLTPSLDEVEAQMRDLSGAIGSLNEQARVILASLASNEVEPIDTATAVGTALVADIEARTERIQEALDAVPIVGTQAAEYELSPATGERYASYLGGLASTQRTSRRRGRA